MYRLRVPASCVLCAPEAQGSLPRAGAGGYCTYAVHVPASGAPLVPGTAYCAVHRRSQDELVRVEAFIGGAKMEEAKRRRGWLRAFLK